MRLAFLGTPQAAVPSLEALIEAGHDVAIVITRPDTRRGRGSTLSPSPVKEAALRLSLSVGHSLSDLSEANVERAVVVAYGAMIPARILDVIPMLNVHFSLLPRWRGAAPVERAILAGDLETGVGIMSLEPTLDTGPLHLERRTTIGDKTAPELTSELAQLGAQALVEVLASEELLQHPVAQTGEPTYAEKLNKETFHVVPTESAELGLRRVRLGGAFCMVADKRLRIDEAEVCDGAQEPSTLSVQGSEVTLGTVSGGLRLLRVQPEGSKPMNVRDWLQGTRVDLRTVRWS